MDAKVTLSFDAAVVEKAKKFARKNNMSLSRLIEYLCRQVTSGDYKLLEQFPIADWVHELAEGEPEYVTKPRSRKSLTKEYFNSRKKSA